MILKQLYEIKESKKGANYDIAKFILSYKKDYNELTATEIAKNCYVSKSYITKFLLQNKFSNFEKFKFDLIEENKFKKETHKNMYSKEINEYANAVVDTLIKTADLIHLKQIDKIVKIIKNSEKIILFGTGGSGIVCRDLYLKLIKLGYFVIYEKDEHLQEFISQNSNSNDVIIIFSYSGPQEKNLKNIKLCHENNSKSIIITNEKKNNQNYSEVIYVNSTETQIRDISILSRIAMQMISDLIVLKIIDK